MHSLLAKCFKPLTWEAHNSACKAELNIGEARSSLGQIALVKLGAVLTTYFHETHHVCERQLWINNIIQSACP